ncbi:hypothetical protein Gpo141_00014195, partial [Globisporangium polare]
DGVLLGQLNGELTLGENIADNGGIHLAYEAYKLSEKEEKKSKKKEKRHHKKKEDEDEDDLVDDQLFFTAFAQNWCQKRTPAYAELLRATDPHSPGRWRVNGPLKNFDKFATAFQCKAGTPMNPTDKCLIW